MVIYEVISGKLPFHKDPNYTIPLKVVDGERPPRGKKFTECLWKVLESCWAPQPNDRPSVEDVLQHLQMTSNLSDPYPPGSRGGVETDSDSRDSSDDSSNDSNRAHKVDDLTVGHLPQLLLTLLEGAEATERRGPDVQTALPTPAGTGLASKRGREEDDDDDDDDETPTKRPKVGTI